METIRYLFSFILAIIVVSCTAGPHDTFYSVSVSIAPDATGSISPAADSSYEEGSRISLQANAKEGYQFTGWTGDLDTTANPLSLTVDRDYTLTANFTENQFFLHENGVTILCPEAEPGQKGEVDGKVYTAVDRALLNKERDRDVILTVCTSPVTDMSSLFASWDYEYFDGDIGNWDVSNVTRMDSMFYGLRVFDQDLNHWDVSSVTDMSSMFEGTGNFNGDISSWDVSNVINMSRMFRGAEYFNRDISNWDVSKVTDMSRMFNGAYFNQDLSTWDVSNVTDMSRMFSGSVVGGPTRFNGNISDWDVSNVAKMDSMFYNATSFNADIGRWDVSKVTSMNRMFSLAENFNQNLNSWDVSNVTDMSYMFSGAENFNQDLSGWCVEKITEEPECFSCESPLSEEYHPVWGTCP